MTSCQYTVDLQEKLLFDYRRTLSKAEHFCPWESLWRPNSYSWPEYSIRKGGGDKEAQGSTWGVLVAENDTLFELYSDLLLK